MVGTYLKFGTAFYPQIDGQSGRVVQTSEDILRACVMDLRGSWNNETAIDRVETT